MSVIRRNLLIGLLGLLPWGMAAGAPSPPLEHTSQTDTQRQIDKWRVGYYQGGEYHSYFDHMKAMVKALIDKGLIEQQPALDENIDSTLALWDWLVQDARSRYLEFRENGYYSAAWDMNKRQRISSELLQRLNSDDGFDVMLAMGTWAGKDLANNRHNTPTLILSTSDPLRADIITSAQYSGFPHIHAHNDPYRYERQIRLFHQVIGFETLGVAYENSVNGRSYAAVDIVEEIAAERGFEIQRCFTQSDIADQHAAGASVIDCFKQLAPKVDAIYVTSQGGINDSTTPALVAIANRYRVPTFSQLGQHEVEQGYLLSLAPPAASAVGGFSADTLIRMMQGSAAGDLNQVFEEPANIVINLKTAELIGLYVGAELIAAADKIYWRIETPAQNSTELSTELSTEHSPEY